MKRLILLILVFIMLISVSTALSEGQNAGTGWEQFGLPQTTATPAPNAFRFRDGIRWGMNKTQIQALETEPMIERSMQNWSIMKADGKVAVSRFTADLVFMFHDDQLMMIIYEFPQGTPESFQYLSGALGSLYGEQKEAEPLKIKALMDTVNPNYYSTEMISPSVEWSNADGTIIYLYRYSASDFAIMYVSPELGSRIYQTNGL